MKVNIKYRWIVTNSSDTSYPSGKRMIWSLLSSNWLHQYYDDHNINMGRCKKKKQSPFETEAYFFAQQMSINIATLNAIYRRMLELYAKKISLFFQIVKFVHVVNSQHWFVFYFFPFRLPHPIQRFHIAKIKPIRLKMSRHWF